MKALGILMNFADPAQRASYPTGLLLLYKETYQLLALSQSPLSTTLLNAFREGITYTVKDKLSRYVTVTASGKKPQEFAAKADTYYSQSGFFVTTDEIELPLQEVLYLTKGLTFTQQADAFETLPLKGLS